MRRSRGRGGGAEEVDGKQRKWRGRGEVEGDEGEKGEMRRSRGERRVAEEVEGDQRKRRGAKEEKG